MTTNTPALSADEFNFDDLQLDNFQLEDNSEPQAPDLPQRDLGFFKSIPVTVTLEVASKEIPLGDLIKAGEGFVIELDKMNGSPLDVKVNGTLLGHAEVVIINDKYGLRMIDVVDDLFADMGK